MYPLRPPWAIGEGGPHIHELCARLLRRRRQCRLWSLSIPRRHLSESLVPQKERENVCPAAPGGEGVFCPSPPSHKMPFFPQRCPRRRQGGEGNEYAILAAGYPSTFLWRKPRAMQNALYGDTQNVVALQGITLKRESSHAGLNPRLGKFMCYALQKYAVFHLKGPVNTNGPKHDFILGNYSNTK